MINMDGWVVNDRLRRCSYATIQSDGKGQFSQLMEQLEALPDYSAHVSNVFTASTDEARVHYVASRMLQHIELIPSYRRKNDIEADALRLEGNKLFQQRHFRDALFRYNKSALRLHYDYKTGEDNLLSLVAANRSACLFHLNLFDEAVNDIHLAMAHGYPAKKRRKLYVRLARCYVQGGETRKARGALQVAKSLIPADDLEATVEVERLETKLNQKLEEDRLSPAAKSSAIQNEGQLPFGDKLDVQYSPQTGRHVVAKRDISVGETVLTEQPYASVLYPEKNGLHCQNCLRRLVVVVPCHECSGVAFCSDGCRQSAVTSFHGVECRFLEVLTGFGCSQVARLALRMIAQKDCKNFLRLKSQLKTADEVQPPHEANDSYVQVFHLVSNNDQRWPEDVFRRTAMACILLKVLQMAGYFPENSHGNDQVFIGKLLLRNLQVLQFNAHEVYELVRGNKRSLKPCKSNVIALAIYPSASLFNHSCWGGVARVFTGRQMSLIATRSVSAGDQVEDNYGPTFYLRDGGRRRQELSSRYGFDCGCMPCMEKWPLLARLAKDETTISVADIEKAQNCMDNGDAVQAFKKLVALLEAAKDLRPPSENMIRAEDKLRTCISNFGSVFLNDNKQ